MTWFAELFGFPESHKNIKRHVSLDGVQMHSAVNERTFTHGSLETPSLAALRTQVQALSTTFAGPVTLREVLADAQDLHRDPTNAGALFQVASQFNLLEMVSPSVTPDRGITRYEGDRTQGPACAIACAAGTLHRNWFAQSTKHQIDTIDDVGAAIGNERNRYWEMRNGYALLNGDCPDGLPDEHADLKIGLQHDTEVTLERAGHFVTQAYCSALPIAYSPATADQVDPLGRMVLNSAYEATLAAGVVNAARTANRTVFLTMLGGGVFGNPSKWITGAIERAATIYANTGLDIAIVSYGSPNPDVRHLLR